MDTLITTPAVQVEQADKPRIYTATQREKSRSNGRMHARMAVAGRKDDAQRFLVLMLNALEAGIEAGADKDFLSDTAKGAHDAISNLVGGMRRDLDNEGCDERDADIDMAELDALIATLMKETRRG